MNLIGQKWTSDTTIYTYFLINKWSPNLGENERPHQICQDRFKDSLTKIS